MKLSKALFIFLFMLSTVLFVVFLYYGVTSFDMNRAEENGSGVTNAKPEEEVEIRDAHILIKNELHALLPETTRKGGQPAKTPFSLSPSSPPPPPEAGRNYKASVEALKLFKAGDYATAARMYEKLARKDNRALLPLGLSYYMLNEQDKALRTLTESLSHKDEFIARKVLARIYYDRNELEDSIDNANKALGIKEDQELRGLLVRATKQDRAEGKFIKESTAHFTLLFDGYGHGGMSRGIIDILEDAYRGIGRELNHFPLVPVTVILYTEKDFYDITRQPRSTRGIYDGKIRLPLRGAEESAEMLRRVIFHEYAHALVHSITQNAPRWINEGLAEHFSGASRNFSGQSVSLGSLEESFSGEAAYDASYAAVTQLIDKHGIFKMKLFLVSLSEGRGLNDAFRDAFYVGYDEFVSTWGKG